MQTDARLPRRPRDMGREEAARRSEQRVLRVDGLLGDDIGTVVGQLTALQGGGDGSLIDQAAACGIEQDGAVLRGRTSGGAR